MHILDNVFSPQENKFENLKDDDAIFLFFYIRDIRSLEKLYPVMHLQNWKLAK